MESSGNATWVCFDCREVVRRPSHFPDAVRCPKCGHDCRCLGTQIRIPTRGDDRAWRDLRDRIRDHLLAARERTDRMRIQRRHRLERQIAKLEASPAHESRALMLHRLRERLSAL